MAATTDSSFKFPWLHPDIYQFQTLSMYFSYSWSDDSVLDYTNWASGQPDDNNGMEQCAEHYVDLSECTFEICKKLYEND